MDHINTDILIIGSGIAGLYCALSCPKHLSVTIVTKSRLQGGNSYYAQGGIAMAVAKEDNAEMHKQDTLKTGCRLSDEAAVDILVSEGPVLLEHLLELGVPFTRLTSGGLELLKEGAHSRRRVLHIQDETGRFLEQNLIHHVRRQNNITVLENHHLSSLMIQDGVCLGAYILSEKERILCIQAQSTVLATGGASAVYAKSTNWSGAIGDGVVAAFDAGADVRDMEFIQFHPTAVDFGRGKRRYFLISESVRGEGAFVVDETGNRFLFDYDSRGELASRDEVARALASHAAKGHAIFLDCRPIGPQFPVRFPGIYTTCLEKGLDATVDLIPIGPVAHYMIGGISTTPEGQTSIPSLYACGEVASTGIHGANRLASNSLLECLVFGHRVARDIADQPLIKKAFKKTVVPVISDISTLGRTARQAKRIKQMMYEQVGIVREEQSLIKTLSYIEATLAPFNTLKATILSLNAANIRNQLMVSRLIVQAALSRKESRGTHFRSDYSETNADLDYIHTLSAKPVVQ